MSNQKSAVILGAYGFIGSACLRALKSEGFKVTGVGRSLRMGRRCDPGIEWLERDIASTSSADWARDLDGVDIVINASGALQDGARDSLHGIHETAISRLIEALTGSETRFIQISAAGVSDQASTDFMRSKARGDRMLMASSLGWIILRPTLVLGAQAYGGTALLRASAALPLVGFKIFPNAPVQTVHVDDVARAVAQAAHGEIASNTVADLTEHQTHSFQELVDKVRCWQGYEKWRVRIPVPGTVMRAIGLVADGLGWFGWRSPLRTTALMAMADGVTGNPDAWQTAGGGECHSLDETLASLPSTTQERWFARLFLLLPFSIGMLSLFWVASGLFGLLSHDQAMSILTNRNLPNSFATIAVLGGSGVDLLLGIAILVRQWAKMAALGMIAVSAGYLVAASIWVPDLWFDPLGPLLKILPGLVLAIIVTSIIEDR